MLTSIIVVTEPRKMNEYRCTINSFNYGICEAKYNLLARNGHYIKAESRYHALQLMAKKHPDHFKFYKEHISQVCQDVTDLLVLENAFTATVWDNQDNYPDENIYRG